MPEDETTPTPKTTPNAPAFTPPQTPDPAQVTRERDEARAENERLKARLAEQESTVNEKQQAEMQAQIDAAKKEAADAKAEADSIKAERTADQRRAALTGKVSDPNLALKSLDPDKHLDKQGNVDVAALIADYPALAPAAPAATAPDGGGGTQSGANAALPDLDAAVKSGDPAQINAAFEAQLAQQRSAK